MCLDEIGAQQKIMFVASKKKFVQCNYGPSAVTTTDYKATKIKTYIWIANAQWYCQTFIHGDLPQ